MRPLRLLILALGIIILVGCGTSSPSDPVPRHIRQSNRHLNLANGHFTKGCYIKALEHYQQAHERYAASDHLTGIAHSLNGIANVYYRLGELPSAIKVYTEAIEVYGMVKDREKEVRATCNKSAALISAMRLDEAEAILDQADRQAATGAIVPALRKKTRAMLMMKRQATQRAQTLLQEAITAAEDSEPEQLSSANYTLGLLLLAQKRPSKAITHLKKSLQLDRSAGAYDDIAHDLNALGQCHNQLAQKPEALEYYKRSIKIFALLGNAGKVQEIANRIKANAMASDQSAISTLHWATQWLAGNKEANLCR